jgi:hypothetical protein
MEELQAERPVGAGASLPSPQSPSSPFPLPHLLQGLQQSTLSTHQGADLDRVLQEGQALV